MVVRELVQKFESRADANPKGSRNPKSNSNKEINSTAALRRVSLREPDDHWITQRKKPGIPPPKKKSVTEQNVRNKDIHKKICPPTENPPTQNLRQLREESPFEGITGVEGFSVRSPEELDAEREIIKKGPSTTELIAYFTRDQGIGGKGITRVKVKASIDSKKMGREVPTVEEKLVTVVVPTISNTLGSESEDDLTRQVLPKMPSDFWVRAPEGLVWGEEVSESTSYESVNTQSCSVTAPSSGNQSTSTMIDVLGQKTTDTSEQHLNHLLSRLPCKSEVPALQREETTNESTSLKETSYQDHDSHSLVECSVSELGGDGRIVSLNPLPPGLLFSESLSRSDSRGLSQDTHRELTGKLFTNYGGGMLLGANLSIDTINMTIRVRVEDTGAVLETPINKVNILEAWAVDLEEHLRNTPYPITRTLATALDDVPHIHMMVSHEDDGLIEYVFCFSSMQEEDTVRNIIKSIEITNAHVTKRLS